MSWALVKAWMKELLKVWLAEFFKKEYGMPLLEENYDYNGQAKLFNILDL
jgi:hypothetical protein